MVFILNGEMIPDNDPRALAARGGGNNSRGGGGNSRGNARPSGGGNSRARGGVHSINSTPSSANSSRASPNTNSGPLASLAKMMGIEGQFLTTPRFSTFLPETKVPYVYLVVLAGLTMFMGIRAPLVAVVCWYIYHHQYGEHHAAPSTAGSSTGTR